MGFVSLPPSKKSVHFADLVKVCICECLRLKKIKDKVIIPIDN